MNVRSIRAFHRYFADKKSFPILGIKNRKGFKEFAKFSYKDILRNHFSQFNKN